MKLVPHPREGFRELVGAECPPLHQAQVVGQTRDGRTQIVGQHGKQLVFGGVEVGQLAVLALDAPLLALQHHYKPNQQPGDDQRADQVPPLPLLPGGEVGQFDFFFLDG